MKKEILLGMVCGGGFGDQYASILSVYKAYKDLIKLGYEVKVAFLGPNQYFDYSTNLSVIWDLSPFNCEIMHIKDDNILSEYQKIRDGHFHVYGKNINNELDEFKFYYYGRYGLIYNSDAEFFESQFVNQEILDLSKKLLIGKKNIFGVHLRIFDDKMHLNLESILEDEYYYNAISQIEDYISKNPQYDYMVCSNNTSVKNYFNDKFENVFINKFSYDLMMYNVLQSHGGLIQNEDLIKHSQEILSEMVSFAECKKIWSINTFYSNFITYGIVHNKYHKDWISKNNDLLY